MKISKNSLIIATAAIALGCSISPFAFASTSGGCAMAMDGAGNYYVCRVIDKEPAWVNTTTATAKAYKNSGDPLAYSTSKKCKGNSPISEDGKTLSKSTLTWPAIFSEDNTSTPCFSRGGLFGTWVEGE